MDGSSAKRCSLHSLLDAGASSSLPCPCTQCTRSVNARDRDFVPILTALFLNATMTIEEALAELDALNPDKDF